ncbi:MULTISPECIES: 2Fe-2S iron-sulfur cluster-binding protein [unclassified Nonomuraea]|uniref:2Fe-2S iron-sulfur cluster-binding protein n=1 Tax=unclassified Nonomuraea TaxID=2593643 RepID=UPI0033F346AB
MRVQVEGVTAQMADDASVLDVVRAAGIELPTLCHDDRLTSVGSCRTCLVRSGGRVTNIKDEYSNAESCSENSDSRTADQVKSASKTVYSKRDEARSFIAIGSHLTGWGKAYAAKPENSSSGGWQ